MFNFFIFVLGSAVGSFLGVLADRLPRNKPVIFDRSRCDHCGRKLGILDLIPLLSFIFLLGRCRKCQKPISLKYPFVELLSGLGFLYLYLRLDSFSLPSPPMVTLIYLLFLFSSLVVISLSDIKYLIIPNTVLLPTILLTLVYQIIYLPNLFLGNLLSAAGAFLFLYLIYLLTKGKGMGLGDVKYAFLMGLLLGYPEVIIAFYLSFLTGAVISIILLLAGQAKLGKPVPFAPFLVLATIVTFIWKEQLPAFFLKLLF